MLQSNCCRVIPLLLCAASAVGACQGDPVGAASTVTDAGLDVGSAGASGSSSNDAGSDVAEGGADADAQSWPEFPLYCGSTQGLQADSAWPMAAYCATRQGRGPVSPTASRNVKWVIHFDGYTATTPSVRADGVVLVGTLDWGSTGIDPKLPTMHAVAPGGKEVWSYDASPGAQISAPAIGADGTAYFSVGGTVAALWPNGGERFRKSLSQLYAYEAFPPSIGPNGEVYVSDGLQRLFALSPNGDTLWTFDLPGFVRGGVAVGPDGVIYVSYSGPLIGQGRMVALTPDGKEKWTFDAPQSVQITPMTSPVVDVDRVYVAGDNHFWGLDFAGASKFEVELAGSVSADLVVGADARVIVSTTGNALKTYAFDRDGVERWSRPDVRMFGQPAAGANGVILWKDWGYSRQKGGSTWQLFALSPQGNAWDGFDGDPQQGVPPPVSGGPSLGADGVIFVGLGKGLYAIGD